MPISTTSRKAGPYPGNGVARTFSFNFKVFGESELRVSVTNEAGLEQVLPLNVSYTVSLNPDQDADAGGTITLSSPLAAGMRLVVLSDIKALQPIDMTNQGGFYPDTVNEGFDRATALIQQLAEETSRAVTVPPSAPEGMNLSLPEPAAGSLLAWGQNGLHNLNPDSLITFAAYGDTIVDKFTSDGESTIFTLSHDPAAENNLRVSVDGVTQSPGDDFTWDGGAALRFFTSPPPGTRILVQYLRGLPETGGASKGDLLAKADRVATLGELRALPFARPVFVEEEGRSGWFAPAQGDQSANVAADPSCGIWLAPSSAPSGSEGAWRRIFQGPLDPVWFGGKTSASINAALQYARINGYLPVVPTGLYVCTETIGYAGGSNEAPHLDLTNATLWRQGDYGPTVLFRCEDDGTPLERGHIVGGRYIDATNDMTVANSRAHLELENVNFVTWGITEIIGGCGGVRLLGCATDIQEGRASWRFGTVSRGAGSVGYYKGPSLIVPSLHGGDSAINGTIDIYCGGVYHRTGSTSGSSATVTINTGGIQVGDIVTGNGTVGDPYALIPNGTTVTAVSGTTATLSTAVNLPANTALVFYRPALDDGFRVESCDGLWGEGFVHVIGHKANAFRFGSDKPFWNVRLKFMADFGVGNSILIEGSNRVDHSTFYSHNQYGPTTFAVGTPAWTATAHIEYDGNRSTGGYEYGGPLKASGGFETHLVRQRSKGGYAEAIWQTEAGVQRYHQFLEDASGRWTRRFHNDTGVLQGEIDSFDPVSQMWQIKQALQFGAVAVSDLQNAKHQGYSDGTLALCYDVRRLTVGGALEGAGAGGLGFVVKSGTKWYLLSTNIEAQA